MRFVSSVVILSKFLYSPSACLSKIGIAHPLNLVSKDSNIRSSSLHIHPLVIAGMNRFRMVFSIGSNKLLISGIVLMK